MKKGKFYFNNQKAITLYHDFDATAWGNYYFKSPITDKILKNFISQEPLPFEFDQACNSIQCNPNYILRVWAHPFWHEDVDIVGIANMLSVIPRNTNLSQNIYKENIALLNHIIENYPYEKFYKYYEPKITGTIMMLFYHKENSTILTPIAEQILLRDLKLRVEELKSASLVARWGGGEDWFFGYNIITVNDRIPHLMYEYAKKLLENAHSS